MKKAEGEEDMSSCVSSKPLDVPSVTSTKETTYVGLTNIGATCYMNSVLQTLFMTPEFRRNIYKWNSGDGTTAEECIPLQLQILFGKMQLRAVPYIGTNDLAKSFGWDYQEGWEQHDTQEFVRVLLDAIEKSYSGSKNANFINEIYEGTSINYVRCLDCNHESATQENFLDLLLTVRNVLDRTYNDSLALGIQRYIKPERLDGDNQYRCNACDRKVDALRGTRLVKLPTILSFVMNRFMFDFETMKRMKLDDFVSFPFVLNMNDYIGSYDDIKHKLPENTVDFEFSKAKSTKPVKKPFVSSSSSTATNAQSNLAAKKPTVVTRPTAASRTSASSQTKQFLQSLRAKKAAGGDSSEFGEIITVPAARGRQADLDVTSGSSQVKEVDAMVSEELSSNVSAAAPGQVAGPAETTTTTTTAATKIEEDKILEEDSKESGAASTTPGQKQRLNRMDRSASQKKSRSALSKDNSGSAGNMTHVRESSASRREDEEKRKQDYKAILSERLKKNAAECNAKIEEYLKEGPLVYELYSILIHSGGAYGGHYYAYIKSFEDGGRWHCFNDSTIMEVDVSEIPERVFGGNNTNAYMVFYRRWEPMSRRKDIVDDCLIPENVHAIIEQHKDKWVQEQNLKLEQQQSISLKIHYILNVKVIQVKQSESLIKVLEHVIREFRLSEKRENIRLRRYKPFTDEKLETFEDIEHLSLEKLKISHFANLCVEIKKDGESFEEYDSGSTFVRMTVYRRGITSIEESALEITKVTTRRNATIYRLMEQMARAAEIDFSRIQIVKRVENIHGISSAELISTSANYDAKLEDLGIFESQLLYVEEKPIVSALEASSISTTTSSSTSAGSLGLKWQEVFDTEQNKITIKFNDPSVLFSGQATVEYSQSIVVDNRSSMESLKLLIAEQLMRDPEQIIMRRGGLAGVELKEMNRTIRSMNFINQSPVFLEIGTPAKEGEIRVSFYLAKPTALDADHALHVFEEIGELPIHGGLKASDVKKIGCEFLKKTNGKDLDPSCVRLREKMSESLGRVYREKRMREQQVIERRMIALEQMSSVVDDEVTMDSKEFLVHVRVWNPSTWDLSDRFEMRVSKLDSAATFSMKIASLHPSVEAHNMAATKVNSVWNFNRMHLAHAEWFDLQSSDFSLGLHPFHVTNDGVLFIVKDKEKIQREPTEEESKAMGSIQHHSTSAPSGIAAMKLAGFKPSKRGTIPVKEKALSIKVKKKEEARDSSTIISGESEHIIEEKAVVVVSGSEGIESSAIEEVESKEITGIELETPAAAEVAMEIESTLKKEEESTE